MIFIISLIIVILIEKVVFNDELMSIYEKASNFILILNPCSSDALFRLILLGFYGFNGLT